MAEVISKNNEAIEKIIAAWEGRYPACLKLWSLFTRLRAPVFCRDSDQAAHEELLESFAQIRLTDHRIILNMEQVMSLGLADYPQEIMGHEIGHHVYCPADLSDFGRMIARMRRSLPGHEDLAAFVGNLYTDLLINDRLYRIHGLHMDRIYLKLKTENGDRLWNFYMRIYEILWSLPRKTLTTDEVDEETEGDARIACDLVRAFSRNWISGSGRFAAICLPYLIEKQYQKTRKMLKPWTDTLKPGDGKTMPDGLSSMDDGEEEESIHPVIDGIETGDATEAPVNKDQQGRTQGNYREPFEYGQILRAMGINVDDLKIAARYYRERAIPHLIPFPVQETPQSKDPLPEGLDVWDVGAPLERIDWMETALRSPVIIPGLTTLERTYGTDSGGMPAREPVDLDLYVDCSGSMPNPQRETSYLTLAGAIIALSALRSGSRVQATLWSGTRQFKTTGGFISKEDDILAILCGYFGDGTAFPIHLLRDTYSNRSQRERKAHILIISDDGVDTLYAKDEKGSDGYKVAEMALAKARSGGTMVLNLYQPWQKNPELSRAAAQGWDIYPITKWDELVDFSRAFVKKHYSEKEKANIFG